MDFGDVIKAMKKDNTKKFARKGWNGKGIYIQLQVPDENSKMTLPYIYMVTNNLKSDNPDAPRGCVPWLASQTDMLCDDWIELVQTRIDTTWSLCAHTMKEIQDYKFDNQPNPDKKYDAVQNPAHYCAGRKIEPWDVMIDWDLRSPIDLAIKYIARAGRKQQPGMTMEESEEQDLQKAINCLKKGIEAIKEER